MEDPVERRFIVLPIVVYPSSKDWITDAGQLFQAFVTPQVKSPTPHLSAYLFGRLITDGRKEANKVSPVSRLAKARAKGKTQEIKSLVRVATWPLVILTVDNPRLLRMKLQLALGKPPLNRRSDPFGLPLTSAMDDDVIGITLKGNGWITPPHPHIERIMEEEIGQQRADYSPNAKGNFEFTRVIRYQRSWNNT